MGNNHGRGSEKTMLIVSWKQETNSGLFCWSPILTNSLPVSTFAETTEAVCFALEISCVLLMSSCAWRKMLSIERFSLMCCMSVLGLHETFSFVSLFLFSDSLPSIKSRPTAELLHNHLLPSKSPAYVCVCVCVWSLVTFCWHQSGQCHTHMPSSYISLSWQAARLFTQTHTHTHIDMVTVMSNTHELFNITITACLNVNTVIPTGEETEEASSCSPIVPNVIMNVILSKDDILQGQPK